MKKQLLFILTVLITTMLHATVPKTVNITTAGSLSNALTSIELSTVTNLTITGTINTKDFQTLNYNMPSLSVLDLSGVIILGDSIPENAISGKSTITSISIPSSVTSIGISAFENCTNLYSITIPSSVTSIRKAAFQNCTGLISITFTNPSSLISIGDAAFWGCIRLSSITIPSSTTVIGNSAFEGCISITSIAIPSSVTSIGNKAYMNCTRLTSITIPSSVKTMGDWAFYNDTSLTSVTFTGTSSLSSIGNYIFEGCSNLKSIDIPSSVTSIGLYAFSECVKLTSITIPSSVISIGIRAFDSDSSLTSISIPSSVTSIAGVAFVNCTGLTSITIPSSVTYIGTGAFGNCKSLITVDASNPNYSSIDGVLYDKTQDSLLQCPTSKTGNFAIPSSVKTIGIYAFWKCSGLKFITIPTSISSIEYNAFSNCTSLTSVIIPLSLISIGGSAFQNCTDLQSIYSYSTIPIDLTASSGVFLGVNNATCKLYVPVGSKSLYQSFNQWKNFYNIQELKEINLSVTSISLAKEADSTASVNVISTSNWTASSNQSWLTINPYTATTGNATLTFKVTANTGVARSATITISSTGSNETITIIQAAGNGTWITEINTNYFSIYPNPATEYFTINTDRNVIIQVYSIDGVLIMCKNVVSKETISTGNLPSGLYVLKIVTDYGIAIRNLVVK